MQVDAGKLQPKKINVSAEVAKDSFTIFVWSSSAAKHAGTNIMNKASPYNPQARAYSMHGLSGLDRAANDLPRRFIRKVGSYDK